jgi:hypothetical protein
MLLESLGYKQLLYGMEEVIGSIPIRSTNYSNNLDDLALFEKVQKGPIRACSHLAPTLNRPATRDCASRLAGVTACA